MIPLEILRIKDFLRDGYHILCRVHINDKEFRMVVDTGASITVFNIDKASEISKNNIENNEQKITTFGSGNIKSKYVIIDEMRIGEIVIKNYKTILIDMEQFNHFYRSNDMPTIDGIIGGDILSEHQAIIDYNKREMILV